MEIAIAIEIGAIGKAFDSDPDPDFDRARSCSTAKNLTDLNKCWPLKDL
jgi:hypothetical protein